MAAVKQSEIVETLRTDILRLEGFKPSNSAAVDLGLGPLRTAFPNSTFPLGCVHEFLSSKSEDAAATKGFISGLLGALMGTSGTSLWISNTGNIFPPALKSFGIPPERFIFIDLHKESDVSWAMDEALKCRALTAVVGEMSDLSFTESRRFQLAVEQSQVTGFLLRNSTKNIKTSACVSRWKITSLSSDPIEDLPGIGFPKWRVELLRIRNGRTGVWDIQWNKSRFKIIDGKNSVFPEYRNSILSSDEKKAG